MKHFTVSIDVEDWFQVENLKSRIDEAQWDQLELRVERNVTKILELLDKYSVEGTFFVLGWIAEKVPDLIPELIRRGHEVASHGYNHKLLHQMDEQELSKDISKSIELLESQGATVSGYRAPSFSINNKAFEVLKDLGIRYDASYNNFQFNSRYGTVEFQATRYEGLKTHNTGVFEFPVTSTTTAGLNWPLGGGYFRLTPFSITARQVRSILINNDISGIYLHPWEFDPLQPRVHGLKLTERFRHYYGLVHTTSKLQKTIQFLKSEGASLVTYTNYLDSLESR